MGIGLHRRVSEKSVIRLLTCCEMGEVVMLCVTNHVMASCFTVNERYTRIISLMELQRKSNKNT